MNQTISVVLPNYNGKDLLESYLPFTFQALDKIDCAYEVIIVDDASHDDSVLFLNQEYPDITIIQNPGNKGFSYSCNLGILAAKYDLVLLLNSDVKLMPDYLEKLIPYFEYADTFGVMGKILDKSGEKIEVAAKIPRFNGFKLKSDQQVHPNSLCTTKIPTTFLSGANCLIDRKKLLELEGFDEIYSPFYIEDLDLCVRAWKLGWKCYYEHEATCMHLGSHTTKTYFEKSKIKEIYFRNRMLFHAIHMDRKDIKRWQLYLLFLEVLPKVVIGQFWILKSYASLQSHQKQIKQSRKKIRDLMRRNKGRQSISDVTRDIHKLLINKDLIVL
ncbi:glycosyltransferase family 2 protein [Algoriphagus persicinus]|uniref:glycosyltransferase family 2 protein n=1 Tax=Algoriphagus persicinus TaxID=3108754 RepID=UPI002B39E398|nr:glycosyltransferase family 2 protein [Algoriphagus sp. E1-3-M2]MEB2785638.1 glycosyltransferase family 2 protein [Algoriphagus sp. E1-3-M2]